MKKLATISLPETYYAEEATGGENRKIKQAVHFCEWFCLMRWIACLVATVLIVLSVFVFSYLDRQLFWPLIFLVVCLSLSNIVYLILARRGLFVRSLLQAQIVSDLVFLTLLVHYSGGIENPASFAYLFHIIISGILFERRRCYATVGLAFSLLTLMALSELAHVVPHYTLYVFPHVILTESERLFHAAHEPVYVTSYLLMQLALISLTAYFTTSIMERLHREERRVFVERQRLERILEASEAGLVILDRELNPVWRNERIKEWFELLYEGGTELKPILGEWIGGDGGPAGKVFKEGTVQVVERQVVDSKGGRRFFQITIAPLTGGEGRVYQIAALTQEITQVKKVEAEIMDSVKMVFLGSVAAGIAHEVGNPLASISARLELMEQKREESFTRESVSLLKRQVERIARTVQEILRFSKPGTRDRSMCRINDIVSETISVLRYHQIANKSLIRVDLGKNLPDIAGVRDQLIQVFLNLGLNALEAMPDGGTLSIKTSMGVGDGDNVLVEFADTGKGITGDRRLKIFGPFYTTKESGTGLGLYIVKNLVGDHGGKIEVDENPGGGTAFTVILPAGQKE